jgi:hypothetical protein
MFSFHNFIRRTPLGSLRSYLANRHRAEADEIDWDGELRDIQAEILSAIEQLPQQQNEQVHADFEEVCQLCDDFGQRALRTMLVGDLNAFDALDGAEARGLSVLLSDAAAFRHALSIAYSERLYHGRSWSRYYVSQPGQVSFAQNAVYAFEAELKDLFVRSDGSGSQIMIDSFERPGGNAPCVMVSIFVETLPQSMMEFSEKVPQRTTRRPVIEAALSYSPTEGTIDIVAKGGRPLRDEIGEAFVHHFLGAHTELLPVSPRTFDLDRLRHPMEFATDPEDGIKDVSVTALRLRDLTDPGSRVAVETASGGQGIHALADRWFGEANPLRRGNFRIEHAKLQIMFHADREGRRDKRVTIELRAPNGSNLKEHMRRHDIIASKYLTRWGLVNADQP